MSRRSPFSSELFCKIYATVAPGSLSGLIRHNCWRSRRVLSELITLEGIVITVSIFHYCNNFMTHFLQ
jgi:hypothetical protein